MENFEIEDTSKSLFTQVIINENKYRAMTSVHIIINGKFIVDDIAHSTPYENGNIDLDHNSNLLWKDLGLANTYIGNQLVFITTIYSIPAVTTNANVREFILENNPIEYKLAQSREQIFNLHANDNIVLNSPQTAIAYKLIQIT
jgi:hypothetical protein